MEEEIHVGDMVAVTHFGQWWPGRVTRVWDAKTINICAFTDAGGEGLTSVQRADPSEQSQPGLAGTPDWRWVPFDHKELPLVQSGWE